MKRFKTFDYISLILLFVIFATIIFCVCKIITIATAVPEESHIETGTVNRKSATTVIKAIVPEKLEEAEAIVEEVTEEIPEPEPEPEHVPSEEDVNALSRMAWGEARGTGHDGIAAVMWCVMHRLDAGYADTVLGVVSAPNQFYGYSASHPVTDEIAEIAREVLTAHANGEEPLLPEGYYFFTGNGKQNIFRNKNGDVWKVW